VSTLCSGDYTQASGQTVSVRYWNGCKNATLQRVLRCTVATSTVVNEVCEASQRALCCAVANPGVQCGAVRSSVSGFSVSGFCLFRRGCSNPGVVLWDELLVTGCCEVNYRVVTFLLSKMVGVPPPGGGRGRKSEQRGSKGPGNQGGTPQCGTVWCCGAPCDGSGLALKWNWTLDGRVYASETRRYSRSEEGSGGMLRLKGKGQEDPPKN
jgi:hypothetical protein